MAPSIEAGELVLVNRFVFSPLGRDPGPRLLPQRPPAVGDIVLFRAPFEVRESFVKRIAAGPGSVVDLVDKTLYVDGVAPREPWSHHSDSVVYPDAAFVPTARRLRDQHGPTRIPAAAFFVLGDNRDESWDSRSWGPVPREDIRGRPWLALGGTPSRWPRVLQ